VSLQCAGSPWSWLFTRWSHAVGRGQAQFLAQIRERALSKIRKVNQRFVRYLAHIANGFQIGCPESVLDPRRNRTRSIGVSSGNSCVGATIGPSAASRARRSSLKRLRFSWSAFLSAFMVGDCLLRFRHPESLALRGGQAGIDAFLVAAHFPLRFRPLIEGPNYDAFLRIVAVGRFRWTATASKVCEAAASALNLRCRLNDQGPSFYIVSHCTRLVIESAKRAMA
jgi:hypothetical protein